MSKMHGLKTITNLINKELPDECRKIEFYKWDNNISHEMLYINVLTDDIEKKIYEELDVKDKKEFRSSSAVIFIPMISADRLVVCNDSGIGIIKEYTLSRIRNVYMKCETKHKFDEKNENLRIAVYMILHEFGHWHDLYTKKMNISEYLTDIDKKEELYEEQIKIQGRLSMGEGLDENIKKELQTWMKKYNSTSTESIANMYADEHFMDVYPVIEKYYSNP